jgi:hypothetical protein
MGKSYEELKALQEAVRVSSLAIEKSIKCARKLHQAATDPQVKRQLELKIKKSEAELKLNKEKREPALVKMLKDHLRRQ